MNNHTRITRLKKLKHMLEHHDEIFKPQKVKFDMDVWCEEREDRKLKCYTAACALGSAACYPPFKRAGLKLRHGFDIVFNESYGTAAGAHFFEISENESTYLFMPDRYTNAGDLDMEESESNPITPQRVAARVQTLIDDYLN